SPVARATRSPLSSIAGAAVSNDTAGAEESPLAVATLLAVSPPQASEEAPSATQEKEKLGAIQAWYGGALRGIHRGIESILALRKLAGAGRIARPAARRWRPPDPHAERAAAPAACARRPDIAAITCRAAELHARAPGERRPSATSKHCME